MGWLDSFLHPEKGYQKGQEQLDKYWQQAQGFQQPYLNNSQQSSNYLLDMLNKLSNPQALQDEWNKGYKESDYAKNLEHEATDRGLSAANSMGLGGSSSALQAIQGGTQKIAGEERQNYLNDLMKKYLSGVGLGENIYGIGANSANNLTNNAEKMGENSANMAYGEQNSPGNMLSNILGRLIPIAGGFLTSGGIGGGNAGGNSGWSLTGG